MMRRAHGFLAAASVFGALAHALNIAFGMTWEILWALVLGFALSAAVQAIVSKSEMTRLLPDDSPRTIAVACGLGAASSSCSYAAVALASDRRYRAHRTSLPALPLYQELIVTGAWWDLVDSVATHPVAELLARQRTPMTAALLAWSRAPDRWLRRAAIICQVNAKAGTDLELLYACIEPNLQERDFFIRKAIGWALRAYAWTDPDEVAGYVRANEPRLSALSRREALKNLGGARRSR